MYVPNFIRIERGLEGGPNFKLNKVPYFALKSMNINVLRSATPKLALVPANQYNCDILQSYHILITEINISLTAKGIVFG